MSTAQNVLSRAPLGQKKKPGTHQQKSVALVKVNWQVRPDRLEQLKIYAVKNGRKLYQVLDDALKHYLTTKPS